MHKPILVDVTRLPNLATLTACDFIFLRFFYYYAFYEHNCFHFYAKKYNPLNIDFIADNMIITTFFTKINYIVVRHIAMNPIDQPQILNETSFFKYFKIYNNFHHLSNTYMYTKYYNFQLQVQQYFLMYTLYIFIRG